MKGRFVILILAALFAVTCSKISQVTVDDPWVDLSGDKPVRFDSGVLTKTSLPSNTSFGVFAFLQNGVIGSYTGRWADLASKHWKPNFMYNEEVDFDGADYSYSPVRYWPSNSENTITFWAYWPYNSDVSMVNSSGLSDYSASSEGLPNIRYTVTDGKTDFRDDHHTNTSGAEKISDYILRGWQDDKTA